MIIIGWAILIASGIVGVALLVVGLVGMGEKWIREDK